METIPDHLADNLRILFVGYNPSIRSGETGHHYANPTNRFYKLLYYSGLTPRQYRPEEDEKLLEFGYGFTNIVARPTRGAADISKEEYSEGRLILIEKINNCNPLVVCFVGKGVYQQYSKRKQVEWGLQKSPYLDEINEFVAPSSSGLVRMELEKMVEIYKQLRLFLENEGG